MYKPGAAGWGTLIAARGQAGTNPWVLGNCVVYYLSFLGFISLSPFVVCLFTTIVIFIFYCYYILFYFNY